MGPSSALRGAESSFLPTERRSLRVSGGSRQSGARVLGVLGEPSALQPPIINFQKWILCIRMNINSAFIIPDLFCMKKRVF